MVAGRDEIRAQLLRADESRLIHEMVRVFSTHQPFGEALRKQLRLIGVYLSVWLEADSAIHLFNNPNIEQTDWMPITESDGIPDFREEKRRLDEFADILEVTKETEKDFYRSVMGDDQRFWFIPFSHRNVPFGHYVLGFRGNPPSNHVFEKVKGSLSVLQTTLRNLLYNHFPITGFTYLPSFQSKQTTEAAILFCDIRNSTRMTEVARMADERFTDLVVVLLKSFLEYASRIVSVANIGHIHKFTGDGLLATFGEHLTTDPTTKAKAACSLAMMTARLLVEGFEKLWSIAQRHPLYQDWLGLYNEDLDLRLGVGVNYGRIHFEWFGIAVEHVDLGHSPRGFNEFTAVGDQMNYCQRLCSVANQPVAAVDVLFRSEDLPASRLIAPVVASKTVTYHLNDHLGEGRGTDPLVRYRTDFEHKGKGHPMPGFEFSPGQIHSSLLSLLKSIHDDRLRGEMEKEVQPVVDDRPALKEVMKSFTERLDKLTG